MGKMSSYASARRTRFISFAIPGTLMLIRLRIVRWVMQSSRFHTRLRTVALKMLVMLKSLQEDLKD